MQYDVVVVGTEGCGNTFREYVVAFAGVALTRKGRELTAG